MGTFHPIIIREMADVLVRRSSRANKGQHSKLEGAGRKRKVDVVDDDEGEIRCLCGENVDDGGFMIQCEMCGNWQHGGCMGYEDAEEVKDTYACDICRPDLYKDIPEKQTTKVKDTVVKKEIKKEKKETKKESKDTVPVCSVPIELIVQKSTKRKTPPSEELSDNSDFSASDDEVERKSMQKLISQNPKKKTKTESTIRSPTPKHSSPVAATPRRKPLPINTARRPSQASPQRRSSTSATPSTPVATFAHTPLATTFADHPDQKRVPVARIFAKIFESTHPDKSEALGLAIEHALYTAFATPEHGYGAEYKSQFRSISFNLKDAKNSALRARVVSGDLPLDQLVQLTSEEMANQELKEQAKAIREEGVTQSVLKVQTGPRIRRTHKGEEIVGGEEISAITPTQGTASAPFARAEEMSPSVKADEVPGSPRSISPSLDRPFSPPPKSVGAERKPSTSNFDISNVWSHLNSPKSPQDNMPEPIDLNILPVDLPQNQIDDPDIDRMINDDGGNSPPYSPSAYAFEDPVLSQYPPIWSGTVAMASVAHFSAQAQFVGGPLSVTDLPWSTILPPNLVVDGRIPIDTTTKYLDAQRSSSTKSVIVIRLEAADDFHKSMEARMYQYFHDRQRYGVLRVHSDIVKDAYIVPLSPNEPIPEQIQLMDSHEIPQTRAEPYLLALLVIQKSIPLETLSATFRLANPPPPAMSPPNRDAGVAYSPPTDTIPSPEALGLSPADLAALQSVLIAHPEILTNPQILTNPAILQGLIQQHLSGQRW
jgi:Transcription factor S-II (TFIIS), central domain/SPOC domain/PHD-finger